VDHGEVVLEFIGTQNRLIDMFTKALGRVCFQKLCLKIRVIKFTLFNLLKLGEIVSTSLVCVGLFAQSFCVPRIT
jgi:hypothetical protein